MHTFAYSRVSTQSQTTDNQVIEIERAGHQVDAMYAEDYPFAEPVSLSESDLSPKLGVIYRINPETDVYVQYAHGFRAPPY